MSRFRIITHGGKAHMDELTASALLCVALGEEPREILRLEAAETEALVRDGKLGDEDWVIDCGMELDPSGRLFDHHQSADLPSAALLVFEHFFPELKDSRFHDDIKLISRVDTEGPQSLNDFESIDESRSYWSFSQKLLLKGFESRPLEALSLAKEALEDRINFEEMRLKAMDWLESGDHTEIVELGGEKVFIYKTRPPEELASALRSADKDWVDEHEAVAVYSFDDKSEEGRALFRTMHGRDILDFSKSRPAKPVFAHPAGFLLKFDTAGDGEWKELFLQALKREDSA